jgi:hypothetical protein
MKWIYFIVSGLALAILPVGAIPTVAATPASAAMAASTQNKVAYSAYGLQLSVPKSWKVGYFQNCPEDAPGTLLIGTPLILDNCVNFPYNTNIVSLQPEKSEVWTKSSSDRSFVIHGLHVKSQSTGGEVEWAIVSKSTVVTASGPQAQAVLKTLTTATSKAQAAPGMIKGTEYLETLTKTPVTGIIAAIELDAHGPEVQIHAFDGQYSDLLPPATYRLTGQDGDAPCPPLTMKVQSGLTADVPEIDCQGE